MNMMNLLLLQQNACIAQIKQIKKFFYMGLMFTLMLILIFMFFCKSNIYKINQEISKVETHKSEHTLAVNEAIDLDAQIKLMREKINQIKISSGANKNLSGFLNLLPKVIPDGLYLVSLSWHEHAGIIYGQANNNKTVNQFLNALKNNVYFKQINLIKSDKRHEADNTPPIYFVINFNNHD